MAPLGAVSHRFNFLINHSVELWTKNGNHRSEGDVNWTWLKWHSGHVTLARNPDRSCWHCHTSLKLFWLQPMASWTAGLNSNVIYGMNMTMLTILWGFIFRQLQEYSNAVQISIIIIVSRARCNVLISRSKVRRFKSGWGQWIFSGRKNAEHKFSGRDFKLGVPSLRFQAR